MNVRTFRAPTMPEALALVKRHLGGDAVILHTRSAKVGGIFGWRARSVVEITASDQASLRPKRGSESFASAASQGARAPAVPVPAAVAAYQRARTPEVAPQRAAERVMFDPPAPVAVPATRPVIQAVPEPEPVVMQVRPRRGEERPAMPVGGQGSADEQALYRELADIKLLMNQVLQAAPVGAAAPVAGNMPEALFRHYLRLLESQVSREIADMILNAVREELTTAQLADEQSVRAAVLRHLASLIPVSDGLSMPRRGTDGRPHTIALVGPTGVGKTTTVAKLAATYKLRQGKSVGLITSDTYRIAAVEQLRTYASIIGLPLKVVLTPAEMAAAVESFKSYDVVLIDTAGRSQNAADRLAELQQFLESAQPHETHLVLSTASGEDVLVQTAESFAKVAPNRILLTKLDEAVNFGVVANVLRRLARAGLMPAGAALSYITTGQEVPDHIEQGRADRLARMILDNNLCLETEEQGRTLHTPAGAS